MESFLYQEMDKPGKDAADQTNLITPSKGNPNKTDEEECEVVEVDTGEENEEDLNEDEEANQDDGPTMEERAAYSIAHLDISMQMISIYREIKKMLRELRQGNELAQWLKEKHDGTGGQRKVVTKRGKMKREIMELMKGSSSMGSAKRMRF